MELEKYVILIELIIALKWYYTRTSIISKIFHFDSTFIFIVFGSGNFLKTIKITSPVPIISNLLALKKKSQEGSVLLWPLFYRWRGEF